MEIRALDAPFGCEVVGVDLSRPLPDEAAQRIRQEFLKHGLLIIRNQHLNERQFVDYGRHFGSYESYESTLSEYLKPDYPDILVLSNIVENGRKLGVQDAGQYWHTDRSYVARPAWASILHSIRVPRGDNGEPLGDTLFSSSIAAFAALPAGEQARLRKLSALHRYVFRFSKPNDSMPEVVHPVVLSHPVTGAPCLYVNAGFTHSLVGMPAEESEALLSALYEHVKRDEFTYRHRWEVGDVLMWDNYSTQHCAVSNYTPQQPRLLWRTTLEGFALA